LPALRPGIASGAIFAFLISLDEVPIALFMGGGSATTLPVKIFSAMEISFGGDILAVASVIVIVFDHLDAGARSDRRHRASVCNQTLGTARNGRDQ
jgi:ABC-type spermidine/putrescine transport system permease subunit II